LTPTEIKAIRESFGWSQQDLADLTDFGIATVSRWERGRLLQNRSANKVLMALRDCPAFREYLDGLVASKRNGQVPPSDRNGTDDSNNRVLTSPSSSKHP
jgi:transcriptional regulator with XRE-family HTH domain